MKYFILNEEVQKEIDIMEQTLDELLYMKNHYDNIDYIADKLEEEVIRLVDHEGIPLDEDLDFNNAIFDNILDQIAKGETFSLTIPGIKNIESLTYLFSNKPEQFIADLIKNVIRIDKFTVNDILHLIDMKLRELGFDEQEQEVAVRLTQEVIERIKIFSQKMSAISAIKLKQAIKKIFKKEKNELKKIYDPERKRKRLRTLQILVILLNVIIYIFKQRNKIKKLITDGFQTKVSI